MTAAMAPIAMPAMAPSLRLEWPLLTLFVEDCAVADDSPERVGRPCEDENAVVLEAFKLAVTLDDTREENGSGQQGIQGK